VPQWHPKKWRLLADRMPRVRSMLKVVLIEEDIAMQALIAEWLTQAGYGVEVSRGGAATPLAGVDLVIADLPKLREGDAPHVRALRASYPGAPVIGLSAQLARSLPGSSGRAQALGVAVLLSKPCTSSELLAAVAAAVGPAR
jgi:DNA-binding response OmpR family regulator